MSDDALYKLFALRLRQCTKPKKPDALTSTTHKSRSIQNQLPQLDTYTRHWCTIHCTDSKSNKLLSAVIKDHTSSKVRQCL